MSPVSMWLMEHGPWLWKGLVAATAVGAGLVGPRVLRSCERVRLRRSLRAAGEPLRALQERRARPAVLQGTLEGFSGDGVLVASGYRPRYRDDPGTCASWSAPGVIVATPHGRISLEGVVHVAEGRAVPNDPRLVEREDAPFDRVLTLRAGDTVRVSGVVEPVASSRPAQGGYRRSTTAWRLVPGGGGVIRVLAVDVPPVEPGIRARLAHAGVAGLCAFAVTVVVGTAALARATALQGEARWVDGRLLCAGAGGGWAAVAAASPFTRDRAFEVALRSLACREGRSRDDAWTRVRLVELRARDEGDPARACADRVLALHEGGFGAEASTLKSRCAPTLGGR